jgi:UDP-N-acetylglucosamine:LPS N-acetylglucosamine transferase
LPQTIVKNSLAKILDIVPYKILPAHMGGQKGIAIFLKYLGEQHELTTVSVMANEISLADTYELVSFFSDSRLRYLNPFYLKKIKKIIRERNIQNVITEHPYMAWMGWMLKKQLKIKWFVHSHNIEYIRFSTLGKWWFRPLRLYEKWAYSRADTVFFKTPEDIRFAIDHSMVKPEHAFLTPYGIELKEMPADIQQQKEKIYALS